MSLSSFLGKARDQAIQTASELTEKIVASEFGQEIGAAGILDKSKSVAHRVRSAGSAVKKQVYKGIGTFEREFDQGNGLGGGAGKAIKRGRLLARGLRFLSKPAVSKGKEYAARGQKYFDILYAYNSSFIETFTTEGKYDDSKLKDAVLHYAAVAEVYGKNAAEKLVDLSKRGAGAVYEDYRTWAPTMDELKGKYAGIGTRREGFIFKKDLEACLGFHDKAFQQLPRDNPQLSLAILQDIKTNAVPDKESLLQFYVSDVNVRGSQDKFDTAEKYLQV